MPTPPSPLGRLLLEAKDRKSAEQGYKFTFRQWEQEIEELTGERISFAHLSNIIRGTWNRRPRKDGTVTGSGLYYRPRARTLAAVLAPLRGYIDESQAWALAGHTPPEIQEAAAELRAYAERQAAAPPSAFEAEADEWDASLNRAYQGYRREYERFQRLYRSWKRRKTAKQPAPEGDGADERDRTPPGWSAQPSPGA